MKVQGRCHCGEISVRSGRGARHRQRLPLSRLPDAYRLGLPRQHRRAGRALPHPHRQAARVCKSHRQRRPPGPCLLRKLRLAGVFLRATRSKDVFVAARRAERTGCARPPRSRDLDEAPVIVDTEACTCGGYRGTALSQLFAVLCSSSFDQAATPGLAASEMGRASIRLRGFTMASVVRNLLRSLSRRCATNTKW